MYYYPWYPYDPSRSTCAALKGKMDDLRAKHSALHQELLDTQLWLNACLTSHSDAAIEAGACAEMEMKMAEIRAEQQDIFQQYMAAQQNYTDLGCR